MRTLEKKVLSKKEDEWLSEKRCMIGLIIEYCTEDDMNSEEQYEILRKKMIENFKKYDKEVTKRVNNRIGEKARHWAAKEMAKTIFEETLYFTPSWGLKNFPYLAQLLKKEWFR